MASKKRRRYFVGVDVGGLSTKILLRLAGKLAMVDGMISVPTLKDAGEFLRSLEHALAGLLKEDGATMKDVESVGLITPGPMDRAKGMILESPNLRDPSWVNFRIRDRLSKRLGVSVNYDNDANGAGLGEFLEGSGAQASSIAGFTLGTGIGGFYVFRNGSGVQIHRGEHDHGAELGHIKIFAQMPGGPKPRRCGCKQRGCLEAYGSAAAMEQIAEAGLKAKKRTRLRSQWRDTPRPERVRLIDRLAKGGDKFCQRLMDQEAYYLALGITQVLVAVDPEKFVLLGGMTRSGKAFLKAIRDFVKGRRGLNGRKPNTGLTFPTLVREVPIEFGDLGPHAGAVGATYIAQPEFA